MAIGRIRPAEKRGMKQLTRQRKWQLKMASLKRCQICGKPTNHYKTYCDAHAMWKQTAAQGLQLQALEAGREGASSTNVSRSLLTEMLLVPVTFLPARVATKRWARCPSLNPVLRRRAPGGYPSSRKGACVEARTVPALGDTPRQGGHCAQPVRAFPPESTALPPSVLEAFRACGRPPQRGRAVLLPHPRRWGPPRG